MNYDLLYNIMLQSNINDIKALSLISIDAQNINKTPQFWHDKMLNDDIPIVSTIYNKKEYIKLTKIKNKVKEIIDNYKLGYITSMNINTYPLPQQFDFILTKQPRMLSISKTNHGYVFEALFKDKKYKKNVNYDQLLNYLVGFYHSIYSRLNSSWR